MKKIVTALILLMLAGCVKVGDAKPEKQESLAKMDDAFPFSKAAKVEIISYEFSYQDTENEKIIR